MSRHSYALLLLLIAMALAIAGCGDSEDDGPGPGAYGQQSEKEQAIAQKEAEQEEKEEQPAKKGYWGVAFGAGTDEGMLLVDLAGHTIYVFDMDKGNKSTCYGACEKTWPPVLAEDKASARAGGSAKPSKMGTTKRRNGTIQLTYAGHPLYRYSGDRSGEINGNGVEAFGGTWYAIRPSGEKVS